MHPKATVKGTDLSPIQPTWVPPNVQFEIDDFNLDWIDTEKYDLIHDRELLGSVPDWMEFYTSCFKYVDVLSSDVFMNWQYQYPH